MIPTTAVRRSTTPRAQDSDGGELALLLTDADHHEGPSMMPPRSLPSPRADGMTRPATRTKAEVQINLQARTTITEERGTR